VEGDQYISLLDECGGHTNEYHFHERLTCLYSHTGTGAHSTRVGVGMDGQYIYGKWEDEASSQLPLLDACGGHFGPTPEDESANVYHYHVQDVAPFTFGCYGPILDDESGKQKLVALAECRDLYDSCGDGDSESITTNEKGTFQYDPFCPCYDANGSNVGNVEKPVFDNEDAVFGPDAANWNEDTGEGKDALGDLAGEGEGDSGAHMTMASGTSLLLGSLLTWMMI